MGSLIVDIPRSVLPLLTKTVSIAHNSAASVASTLEKPRFLERPSPVNEVSWYSPWLCSLVSLLFLTRRLSHTQPLLQAYSGRCPAVMGTIPDLDGNIFPSNWGFAVVGTIPELDRNIFPRNS